MSPLGCFVQTPVHNKVVHKTSGRTAQIFPTAINYSYKVLLFARVSSSLCFKNERRDQDTKVTITSDPNIRLLHIKYSEMHLLDK